MDDYKIEIPHFYCLEYSENVHKMHVDIDFREPEIILTSSLINNWEKPFDKEIIPINEKKRIIQNIYYYLLKNNSSERIKMEE